MRILKCNIENFGKISNSSFEFSEGINTICEENGFGKTTLATFIRVMFFGFDNEGKRDELLNERKRYQPWQGGVYGGSIEFEVKDREYILTRIFRGKEKDDEFELRDAKTNLPSLDYTKNIGEEVFKIDAGSFERTVFISQNDCPTFATDSINAKLANLVEDTEDINNFENVNGRLKSLLDSLTPDRKTGAIAKLSVNIGELEAKVLTKGLVDTGLDDLYEKNKKEKEVREILKEEQIQLAQEQKELSAYKDIQVQKERYETILEECKERLGYLEKVSSEFPGQMPDKQELSSYIGECSKLVAEENAVNIYKLSEEKNKRLEALKIRFEKGVPDNKKVEDMITLWNKRREKRSSLEDKKDSLEYLKEIALQNKERESKRKICIILLIVGVLLIAGGGALVFLKRAVGMILLTVGAVLAVIGVVGVFGTAKKESKLKSDEEIFGIEEEIAQEEKYIEEISEEVQGFLENYKTEYAEDNILNGLYEIKVGTEEYRNLCSQQSNYENAYTSYTGLKENIEDYVKSISLEPKENLQAQLVDIKVNLENYENHKREYEDALAEKKAFEEKHSVEKLLSLGEWQGNKTMEEISTRLNQISSRLEEASNNIAAYEGQIVKLQEQRDEISESEENLKLLKAEYDTGMKKYNLLSKTKEFLTEAKASVTSKYTKRIYEGFSKYYSLITGKEDNNYLMDANTNLTVNEFGMQKGIDMLSTGYRDLTGICMRMALVEAMYEDEKPVIIFDDPFVNLDERKTESGKRLLENISKEYQIIYFTCHQSRA